MVLTLAAIFSTLRPPGPVPSQESICHPG